MAELYDEDGNPVEALTKEETDAAVAKAAEEAKAAVKAETDTKVKELEEQLQKAKDKETNFAKLRTKTEARENEEVSLKETIASLEKKMEEAKGAGVTTYLDTVREDEIKALADGDAELEKALRANYDILNMPTTTKAQIQERAKQALRLSSDIGEGKVKAPSGPGRPIRQTGSDETPSDDLLGFSSRFGVSKEDFEKFGKK